MAVQTEDNAKGAAVGEAEGTPRARRKRRRVEGSPRRAMRGDARAGSTGGRPWAAGVTCERQRGVLGGVGR